MTPHLPTMEDRFEVIFKHLDLMCAADIWFKEKVSIYEHDKGLIQPTRADLDHIVQSIHIDESITSSCHSPVEFRKYLFNYVS